VTGGWRELYDEEFHNLYSPNIIRTKKPRKLRWQGHVVQMGEKRSAYETLLGKHKEKGQLGTSKSRRAVNIKILVVFKLIGYEGVDSFI
jgi:hypothetical protein